MSASWKIDSALSEKVLTVGPDYRDHRGGIGAVIGVYSKIFEVFNFIPTFRAYNRNYKKSLFFARQAIVFFYVLLKNKKIEIIHIHGSHSGSFFRKYIIFLIATKIFKKKVIYHLHSSTFGKFYLNSGRLGKRMIRKFVREVDYFVCISEFWREHYSAALKREEILLINNVIDFPAVQTKNYSTDDQIIKFLFLGRVGHGKGIFDIMDVLRAESDYFAGKIKLYIGGDGETEKLQKMIRKYKLGHAAEFVGWANKEVKRRLLAQSDVFILPSYFEGMPVSILEAMSYGLPVLTTNVGGIPEIVRNMENGIIVRPGDKAALKEAIDYFITKPDVIERFGKRSREMVAPYLPDAVASQLKEFYLAI